MQAFGLETIGIIKKEKLHELDRKMSDMKGIEVIPYQNEAEDLLAKLQKFLNS
jgi:hypothetical protein